MSQAGALLLTQTARITGLGAGLSAGLARWRRSRAAHDPGKAVLDLAVAVALGGDCLADVGVLRAEPALFGPVASDPVISRLVTALAGDAPRALKAIRRAQAGARQRAWALAGNAAPGSDGGQILVDIDATIVTSCSEKEQAAPTWKKTFGLLTELPGLSSLFSGQVRLGTVTVPGHDRARRAWPGNGPAAHPAAGEPSGDR